ncbi:MAG: PAS domain S-box protein [Pseudanabaenaceae cyanobacterium]
MTWFTQNYPVFSPTTPLSEVIQGLSDRQEWAIIAVGGIYQGLVTSYQLARAVLGGQSSTTPIGEVMDRGAILLNQDPELQAIKNHTPIDPRACGEFMLKRDLKLLPLLRDDLTIVGMVTAQDVLQQLSDRGREKYLSSLQQIQSLLLHSKNYRSHLQDMVNILGQTYIASRAYIFQYHTDSTGQFFADQIVEWCNSEVEPQIDNPDLQGVAMTQLFPQVVAKHLQGLPFHTLVLDYQDAGVDILIAQKILSLLAVPITVNGKLWGFLGFDECRYERQWQDWEIDYLQTAAGTLASTIARQTAEIFYENLFNNSSDALFLVDGVTHRIIDCNQRAVVMFEADHQQQLIGIYGRSLNSDPIADDEFCRTFAQLDTGVSLRREFEYLTLKGNLFWGELSLRKIYINDQKYYLARVSDISDRKRAEQALQEQKEFLESIYTGSGQAILVIDITPDQEFVIKEANPTFEQLTGISSKALQHKLPAEVLPPYIASCLVSNCRRSVASAQIVTYEVYAPLQRGGRWWVTTLTPLFDDQDRPYRIIATSIEISDRKKAEQQLRDSEMLLKETEAISHVGGWFIELKTGRCACTDEVKKILGVPVDLLKFDPLKNPDFYLDFCRPEDRYTILRSYLRLTRKGIPIDLELLITTIGDRQKWVHLSAHPIFDDTGQELVKISGTFADITHRKLTELNLQASENRFRNLVNNLNVGVLVQDTHAKILLINKRALELLGLSEDEALGKTSYDPIWRVIKEDGSLFPPNEHPVVQAIATQKSVRGVTMGVYHSDNRLVWILVNADPQFDRNGELREVVCCFTDITSSVECKQKLNLSQDYCYQVIQSQEEFVLCSLPDTTIVFANNSFCRILGYSSEEIVGKKWQEFVPPEDLEVFYNKLNNLSTDQPTFENVNTIHFAGNQLGITEWKNWGVFDELGNLIQIQSIGRDITKLYQTEQEIQRINHRFRSLIDNSNDIMLIVSPTGIIQYISPSSYHTLGYLPSEVEGKLCLEFVHPDYHQLILDTIQLSIQNPAVTIPPVCYLVQDKKGEWLWLESTTTNLLTDEYVQGIVVNARDVTYRVLMEEELRDRERQLQSITDNLPIIIARYKLNPDGTEKLEYISSGCRDILGIEAESAIANIQVLWGSIVPEYRVPLKLSLVASAEALTLWHEEWEIITPTGDRKWIEGFATPVQNSDGTITWDLVMFDNSDRKCIEVELQQTIRAYQELLNNVPAVVYQYVRGSDGTEAFIYLSDNVNQLYEIPLKEHPSDLSRLWEIIDPEDIPRLLEQLRYSEQHLVDISSQYRIHTPSGKTKWVHLVAHPERLSNGDVMWSGVKVDITEKCLIENSLKETLKNYQELLANVPAVIYHYLQRPDGSSSFPYLSDNVQKLFEIEVGNQLEDGYIIWQMVHPEDLVLLQSTVADSIRNLTPFYQQFRIITPSGQIKWLQSNSRPDIQPNGEVIWVGVFLDITPLKNQAQFLSAISREAKATIYIYDLVENRNVFVNPEFYELLGYTPEEVQAMGDRLFAEIMHPDDYQYCMNKIIQEIHQLSDDQHIEFTSRLRHKDGTYRWILTRDCIFRRDQNGTPTQVLGLSMDITAQKETEEALRRATRQFSTFLNNSPSIIWLADLQGRYLFANEIFYQLFDLQPQQVLGKIHYDFLPREIADLFATNNQYIIYYQTPITIEETINLHGSDRTFLCTRFPVYDDAGNFYAIGSFATDITDHKLTEKQLHEKESVLINLLHHLPVVCYKLALSPEGVKYVYISPNCEQLYGYTAEELLTNIERFYSLIDPAYLVKVKDCVNIALTNRHDWTVEFPVTLPSGNRKWIRCESQYIEQAGEPPIWYGVHIDITATKLLEFSLQESENRLKQILSNVPVAIYRIEQRPNDIPYLVYASANFRELLGLASLEIPIDVRQTLTQVHPEDLEYYLGIDTSTQSAGEYNKEFRVLNDQGTRWLSAQGYQHTSSDGTIVCDGILQDITTFREAQALIEGSKAELEAIVQERTRALENSQLLLMQQLEKNETLLNITAKIRSSVRLGEILQATVDELRQVLNADRVLIYNFLELEQGGIILAEAVNEEQNVQRLIYQEYPAEVFPIDCHHRFLRGKVSVIYDRDNSPTTSPCLKEFMRSLNVASSITLGIVQSDYNSAYLWGALIIHSQTPRQWEAWQIELVEQLLAPLSVGLTQSALYQQLSSELEIRRATEKKLQMMNSELLYANKAKDEFLANMSHELRTPLNSILGLSEGLLHGVYGQLNDRITRSIQTIERSGKHLLALINDILDLSKIEAGSMELNLAPVSVRAICEGSLVMVRQQALKKNIQLRLDISQDVSTIVVDELRWRQVLINLLDNAIKFTNEGGRVELIVKETWVHQQQHIAFTVRDTGIGIRTEDLKKLFKPFVQVDSNLNRRYAGTGLGLCLVKQITELHGGTVSVESEFGAGSSFTVSIPCRTTSGLPLPSASGEKDNQPITAIHGATILLVEDNEDNIETVKDYLESMNYQVVVVRSGTEALARIDQIQPNLVLMDVQMPELDGLETTRRLRARPEYAHLPVIMLTAMSMTGDEERCKSAGADYYITKPCSLKNLVKKIEELLTDRSRSL